MSKVEICWVLTVRCNKNCKYCYRFLDIQEVEYEKNEQMLRKLIADGVLVFLEQMKMEKLI